MGPAEVGRVPGPPSFEPSEVERSLKRPLHPAGRRMTEAEAGAYAQALQWGKTYNLSWLLVLPLSISVPIAIALYPDIEAMTPFVIIAVGGTAAAVAWSRRWRTPPPPENLEIDVVYGELWDARNPFGESHGGDYYIGGRRAACHFSWEDRLIPFEGPIRAEVIDIGGPRPWFLLRVEAIRWGRAQEEISLDADVASGQVVPGEAAWARWRRQAAGSWAGFRRRLSEWGTPPHRRRGRR